MCYTKNKPRLYKGILWSRFGDKVSKSTCTSYHNKQKRTHCLSFLIGSNRINFINEQLGIRKKKYFRIFGNIPRVSFLFFFLPRKMLINFNCLLIFTDKERKSKIYAPTMDRMKNRDQFEDSNSKVAWCMSKRSTKSLIVTVKTWNCEITLNFKWK